jgi:hypothetical protein
MKRKKLERILNVFCSLLDYGQEIESNEEFQVKRELGKWVKQKG